MPPLGLTEIQVTLRSGGLMGTKAKPPLMTLKETEATPPSGDLAGSKAAAS